jgi:hypothetical protein
MALLQQVQVSMIPNEPSILPVFETREAGGAFLKYHYRRSKHSL